jgi:hypothetical protein
LATFVDWREPLPENAHDPTGSATTLVLPYYQRAFALLHQELKASGYDSTSPHPIRGRYWRLLPPGRYSPVESRPLLLTYIQCVESELRAILGGGSVAYWLHLYRRLAPSPISADRQPATIMVTREVLEAAAHKYATFKPCKHVAFSADVPAEAVLGGLLMAPEFDAERALVSQYNQLVLTDFSSADLRECYEAERLAYEVWRAGAMLRIVGKGADLLVGTCPPGVVDLRSTELAELVERYDARLPKGAPGLSATGVLYPHLGAERGSRGIVFIPVYNVFGQTSDDYATLFRELLNLYIYPPIQPNFIWVPHSLRQYYQAHRPFSESFAENHGVSLGAVLAVLAAMCQAVFATWRSSKGNALPRYLQRAYEGPYAREYVRERIEAYLTEARESIGIEGVIRDRELARAMHFWELDQGKRAAIDIAYPGPHQLLLPYGRDRLFIDYAWIARRLYDLLFGLMLADQNFKGDALERAVRWGQCVLPRGQARRPNGAKQADASYGVGDRLVLVECKAFAQSIGFHRGAPEAIRYRSDKIAEALDVVDEKASWFAQHPLGDNYDISLYTSILPVVVTPFVEYVPSLHPRYWLTPSLPRVMTVGELKSALEDGTLATVAVNLVRISR